jgi:peptidoglycan/xylan/chitin deacetylase (PgdA/CDA1 family)
VVKTAFRRLLASPRVLRFLDRPDRPRVVVLMYHDICEDGDFPNWLRVPVSAFDAQLRLLRGLGRIIGPEECREPERLPADTLHFLLTFDDGYLNNLRLALPVLERHEAVAQFFISTGPMASGEPFWSDVVTSAIQGARLESLDLTEFGLGVFRFRSAGEAAWEDVQRCLVAVKNLGNEDHPAVMAVLEHLHREHAAVLAEHLPRYRPLTAAEVATLAGSPSVRIGSHGHHHRILTRLEDEALVASLRESRRLLEGITGEAVRELAYPNGNHDARVRRAALSAGYERAYTVAPGILTAHDDVLQRPRLGVAGVGPSWATASRLGEEFLRERIRRP